MPVPFIGAMVAAIGSETQHSPSLGAANVWQNTGWVIDGCHIGLRAGTNGSTENATTPLTSFQFAAFECF